jgi:hypothetical protein
MQYYSSGLRKQVEKNPDLEIWILKCS